MCTLTPPFDRYLGHTRTSNAPTSNLQAFDSYRWKGRWERRPLALRLACNRLRLTLGRMNHTIPRSSRSVKSTPCASLQQRTQNLKAEYDLPLALTEPTPRGQIRRESVLLVEAIHHFSSPYQSMSPLSRVDGYLIYRDKTGHISSQTDKSSSPQVCEPSGSCR